ncbi:MAG: Transmembrane protease serine 2, partial [Marteilia pararefringens]
TLSLKQSESQNNYTSDGERYENLFNISDKKFPPWTNPSECGRKKSIGSSAGDSDEEQIIKSDLPWLVTLVGNKNQTCRGSLITNQWILTAAHCFSSTNNKSHWKVVFGDIRTPSENDTRISIAKIITHKDFNAETAKNDIALVKLSKAIEFSDSIVPICLKINRSRTYNATEFDSLTAWNVVESEKGHQKIVGIRAKITGYQSCKENEPNRVGDGSEMCIRPLEENNSVTLSDSGEPIIYFDTLNDNWIQLGVASKRKESKKNYKYMILTDYFINWINGTVKSN